MYEEREAGAEEQTIWLTADVAIRQSVSGKCYMQRWGLLYSPEGDVGSEPDGLFFRTSFSLFVHDGILL